jgi:small subunit ribosomal protein S15
MALSRDKKSGIIKKFQRSDLDTGSSEVQIALISKRIEELTEHFKLYKKDNHSRQGLIKLVNQRRSLLDYLKSKDFGKYSKIIGDLGIRK